MSRYTPSYYHAPSSDNPDFSWEELRREWAEQERDQAFYSSRRFARDFPKKPVSPPPRHRVFVYSDRFADPELENVLSTIPLPPPSSRFDDPELDSILAGADIPDSSWQAFANSSY